ncbi:MAG: DUF2062 domain-containing protein [Pseudomonadota bacterium]
MPKEFFRRIAAGSERFRHHRHLRIFGDFIHDPNLWHLNRHAVARGCAVGVFWAFVPIPLQMVFAAGVAILWRANIPLSIALIWITNPVTIPPVFFATYELGTWILGSPGVEVPEAITVDWFFDSLGTIWQPLFVGSLLTAFLLSLISYFTVHWLWRWHIVKRYRLRRGAPASVQRRSVKNSVL